MAPYNGNQDSMKRTLSSCWHAIPSSLTIIGSCRICRRRLRRFRAVLRWLQRANASPPSTSTMATIATEEVRMVVENSTLSKLSMKSRIIHSQLRSSAKPSSMNAGRALQSGRPSSEMKIDSGWVSRLAVWSWQRVLASQIKSLTINSRPRTKKWPERRC